MVIASNLDSVPEDEVLRQQIFETQDTLCSLEQDLGSIDAQLQSLGSQREAFELLEQTCGTLERLDTLGVSDLFWGDGAQQQTPVHVRQVRERAGAYLSQVAEIEHRRELLLRKIQEGQDVLDILETDLYEIELAEEERKQEWVIERELVVPQRTAIMPWSRTEDDQRLRKSLSINLLLALIIGAIIPMIDLPVPDLELLPEVPQRFARLIERDVPPPPPPPPPAIVEEVAPEEIIEPDPDPVVAEVVPEVVPPTPEEPAPEQQIRATGILAFRESFASISENRPAAQLGAQARINDAGQAAVGRTERAMVTSQAPGSSGGINLASLSRDVGGGGTGQQIDGVQVTRVASSIGVSGSGDRPMSAGVAAGRTDEEIQIVFDRYKSALYRLYNRELRNDPSLRGQIVLQLTIEADGSVSACAVQSSTLGALVLEQQVVERVNLFDFGAKEGVSAVTILYPIDFLPAA